MSNKKTLIQLAEETRNVLHEQEQKQHIYEEMCNDLYTRLEITEGLFDTLKIKNRFKRGAEVGVDIGDSAGELIDGVADITKCGITLGSVMSSSAAAGSYEVLIQAFKLISKKFADIQCQIKDNIKQNKTDISQKASQKLNKDLSMVSKDIDILKKDIKKGFKVNRNPKNEPMKK